MRPLFSSLAAAVAFAGLFVAGQPVNAGLGEADAEVLKEFDAWCGKRKNNCKVTFPSANEMVVNGKDGITRDQLQSYQCNSSWRQMGFSGIDHWEYSCLVKYTENSIDRSGKFIFVNTGAFSDFRDALSVFCGPKCRPLGPSINVESD